MSGVFIGLGAKFAENALAKKATGIITAIPKPVWEAFAVIAYVLAFLALHQHYANAAIKRAHDTGYTQAQKDDREEALNLKARIDALNAEISANRRKQHDEAVAHNAVAAGALILHGPGKAACPIPSGSPLASGQPLRDRSSNAALAPVSDAGGINLIALPFNDTVEFGKSADDWRAEALAWEGWYADLVKAWPKAGKP